MPVRLALVAFEHGPHPVQTDRMSAALESPPVVRLAGLRQSYPIALGLARREALHGIDLELFRGQKLGLVGPNGSGKSTLLRVLAGVDPSSGGVLEILGRDPGSDPVRSRIGFLPEDSPFPRELRALEVLVLLATLRRVARKTARERSLRLLDQVGLAADARTPLGRFSRGMLRRFGLAQALVHEPDLILLDEPTAGLDAEGFGVLEQLIEEAIARGASLVISSHLISDVHTHCDRLAVLMQGRIAAFGTPREVLTLDGQPCGLLELYRHLQP